MFNLTKYELDCLLILLNSATRPSSSQDSSYTSDPEEFPKALRRVYKKLIDNREELTKGQP